MNPRLLARLEKLLFLLLAGCFALPLLAAALLLLPPVRVHTPGWVRNKTLGGEPVRPEPVAPSRATLFSAEYQTAFAHEFDTRFIGREILIRLIDEMYLRVFHTSPTSVLVGPNNSLIEQAYASEYCLQRGTPETLRPLVDGLRRMQDFCDARGTAFAIVLSPSKAAIYPEQLPARWLRRYRPEPRYYDLFLALMQERGVRFVDGHRIALELKPTARVPVFPLGGIHWGDPAALATANAVVTQLARGGLGVQPITDVQTEYSDAPKGQDGDLAGLVNTIRSWHYPVVTIDPRPMPRSTAERPSLVCIGGSFAWRMLHLLSVSEQFAELNQYFYYQRSKSCDADGEWHQVAKPAPPIDFEHDIFAADALVLELNEQTLHTPAAHLTEFLHDALAVLPDPKAARAAFHFETRMDYQWGDTLSFGPGEHPVKIAATRGFASPGRDGSRTVGNVATVGFDAPPPAEDMTLTVDAGAYLVDRRLPEQRVSVFANGQAVGEWVWQQPQNVRREVVIPKEALGGGRVTLEFRIARPGSPAEFGLGRDQAKYGIIVTRLRLHAAGK